MKRILFVALLLARPGFGHANEEIVVELPGGAQMEMVWIEPGTFTMGTTEEQAQLLRDKGMWLDWFEGEQPAHQVTISRGFYLGKCEVTQGQWRAVMEMRPWGSQSYVQENPNSPATYISWKDVQLFVQVLNMAAGDSLYRLPTEAEWEYACRAGTNTLWSFGDDEMLAGEYAWYDKNTWEVGEKYAHPVGMKRPNPWGLYDMHGNVWEWCQDWHGPYGSGDEIDPAGSGTGEARVGRGGAFNDFAQMARSAARNRSEPYFYYHIIGARLVRIGKD